MAEELKAGQQIVLHSLFKIPSAKHFIKSSVHRKFRAAAEPKTIEESTAPPKPGSEVDPVKEEEKNVNNGEPLEKVESKAAIEQASKPETNESTIEVKSSAEPLKDEKAESLVVSDANSESAATPSSPCSSANEVLNSESPVKDQVFITLETENSDFVEIFQEFDEVDAWNDCQPQGFKEAKVVLDRIDPLNPPKPDSHYLNEFLSRSGVSIRPCAVRLERLPVSKLPKPEKREQQLLETVDKFDLYPLPQPSDTDSETEDSVKEEEEMDEDEDDVGPPPDLEDIKGKVYKEESGTGYSSVLDFHLDFMRLLNETKVRGPSTKVKARKKALKDAYEKSVKKVYPWFDVKEPWKHFEEDPSNPSAVALPCEDHNYTDVWLRKRKKSPAKKKKTSGLSGKKNVCRDKDERTCQFCGKSGDGHHRGAGRLIYYRQNDWVHVNCTMWASEVFEEVDGSLQNVSQVRDSNALQVCLTNSGICSPHL